jgi:hypothetical protein
MNIGGGFHENFHQKVNEVSQRPALSSIMLCFRFSRKSLKIFKVVNEILHNSMNLQV